MGEYLTSKRSLWLRILLGIFWLAALAFGGMAQGKVSTVSENDQAVFLPTTAESTLASEEAAKFQEGSSLPVLIVAVNDDGTPIDKATFGILGQVAAQLPQAQIPNDLTISELLASPEIPVIPNEDGTAVLMPANLDAKLANELDANDEKRINSTVETMRESIGTTIDNAGGDDNLHLYVSGPAGLAADLGGAFAGIDLTLLLVAVVLVFIILVVVYRSVLLPFAVLGTAITALCAAVLIVYNLAKADILSLNGQTQGILAILVIGATTDYCLLLIARYREELSLQGNPRAALATSLKGSWEPILASGGTVIAGLLTLLLSDLSSTASLGPIASIGIVFAMAAALTLLPPLLLLPGKHARIMFWPAKIPHYDSADEAESHGVWSTVGRFVERNYRKVWILTAIVLVAFAAFSFQFKAEGTSTTEQFTSSPESVTGFELINDKFDAGSTQPTMVIVDEAKASDAATALEDIDGVASVEKNDKVVEGRVLFDVSTTMPSEDKEAQTVVKNIRNELADLDGNALVGGPAAQNLDTQETANADFAKIFPVVLIVIAMLLMLLLRAIVAPLVLLVANVISFAAAFGISAILFNWILDFPGADASVPLYSFVFLVALGIDYTIFLMSRAREESLKRGTHEGVVRAVGVTGGVITSAGIVLAATFAALVVVPLLFMLQLAIIVPLGILIDTFIVRSLLIPGVIYDLGDVSWWPWTKKALPSESTNAGAESTTAREESAVD